MCLKQKKNAKFSPVIQRFWKWKFYTTITVRDGCYVNHSPTNQIVVLSFVWMLTVTNSCVNVLSELGEFHCESNVVCGKTSRQDVSKQLLFVRSGRELWRKKMATTFFMKKKSNLCSSYLKVIHIVNVLFWVTGAPLTGRLPLHFVTVEQDTFSIHVKLGKFKFFF